MTLHIKSQTVAIKILNTVEYLGRPSLILVLVSSLSTLESHLHLQGTRTDTIWIIAPCLYGMETEYAAPNLPTTNWGRLLAGNT